MRFSSPISPVLFSPPCARSVIKFILSFWQLPLPFSLMYPSSLSRSSSSPSISSDGLGYRRPNSPLRFFQSKLSSRRPSTHSTSSKQPPLSMSHMPSSRHHVSASISQSLSSPSPKPDEDGYRIPIRIASPQQTSHGTALDDLDTCSDEGIMKSTSPVLFDVDGKRTDITIERPLISFPPSQETQRVAKAALQAKRGTFRVLYAGNISYKSDRGLLSKTKHEFFVLTNNYILRYKSAGRARAEVDLFNTQSRTNVIIDKSRIFVSLEHIYGVHSTAATANSFRVEYLHPTTLEPMFLQLVAETPKECKSWLYSLRKAVHSQLAAMETVTPGERFTALNRIQKQKDLIDDPERTVMQKVLYKEKRLDKKDGVKEIFLPVLFVIGKFSLYILPVKGPGEEYSKSIERDRHGLLAIQNIDYDCQDDTFKILVRQANGPARQLVFVSTFCEQLLQYLRLAIECIGSGTYSVRIPPYLEKVRFRTTNIIAEPTERYLEHDIQRFNTLLHAYCAALNLNKARFDYDIFGSPTGGKQFRLLPPNEIKDSRPDYTRYELIAILRSFRYNAVFSEIKLSDHSLRELEAWTPTKDDGWTDVSPNCPNHGNVLLNELFALLINAKVLRRIDLTNCSIGETGSRISALIALGLAMNTGKCGLKRICIGANKMMAPDFRALLDGIRNTTCTLKEIDVHECSLTQDQVELLVNVLMDEVPAQLQILDLSNNCTNIDSDLLDCMLRSSKSLASLRLRGMSGLDLRLSLLQACRLRELDLGKIKFRESSVSVLCQWIQTPAFNKIERLYLDECGLFACHLSQIMIAISRSGNRRVHLSIGNNPLTKEVQHMPKLLHAFMQGEGPFSLSLAKTEWEDTLFRDFIECLRDNSTLVSLDLSNVRILDSISDDTVKMLTSLLSRNTKLRELKLDYFASKSNLGISAGQAMAKVLEGLKHNTTLERLEIEGLGMGDPGVNVLARILQTNRVLQSINIDDNMTTIDGFRALRQSIPTSCIIELPKPRKDIRNQLKALKNTIIDYVHTEKETHWYIMHSSGKESKSVKSRLEMQIKSRQAAEANYKRIVDVVEGLLELVAKNRRLYELSRQQKHFPLYTPSQTTTGDAEIKQSRIRGRTTSESNPSRLPPTPSTACGVSRSNSINSGWDGHGSAEHSKGGYVYHHYDNTLRPMDAFSSPSPQPSYPATPQSSEGNMSMNVPYYMQDVPSIPKARRNTDATAPSPPLVGTLIDSKTNVSSVSLDAATEPSSRSAAGDVGDKHGLRRMKSYAGDKQSQTGRPLVNNEAQNSSYHLQQDLPGRNPTKRQFLKQESNP